MDSKMTVCGFLLCLGTFLSFPARAQECFHVVLPQGAKEITVPPTLESHYTSEHGSVMNQSGFKIYDSGKNMTLSGPAHFCLEQDIVRHVGIAALLGEPGGRGPLVELYGSDIVLDLNGHALRSDRASTAIDTRVWGKLREPRKRNYVLRNGVIDVKGSGIILIGWQYGGHRHTFRPSANQIEMATEWFGGNFREFADTNIVLEYLTIKSGSLAAYLVGRNNIIRHCRIEVQGHEAIALFGANAQLIDNEIVVKRNFPPPKADNSMPSFGTYYTEYAAIWIRDAPGAVIRGNKIRIEGWGSAKEAVLIANSQNVTIENNQITGVERVFTTMDPESSVNARDNRKWVGKWPDN